MSLTTITFTLLSRKLISFSKIVVTSVWRKAKENLKEWRERKVIGSKTNFDFMMPGYPLGEGSVISIVMITVILCI